MNKQEMPASRNGREYKMTVAGQLFKHLGLQMYSGAVPAISESHLKRLRRHGEKRMDRTTYSRRDCVK